MSKPLASGDQANSNPPSADGREPGSIERVIDAARGGCGESFGQLAERCRAYLLHVASRELGNDLQAKIGASDVVQESLLEGQQTIGRFRGQSEAELRGWLRQILLHNVAGAGRHYRSTAMRNIKREQHLDVPDSDGGFVNDLPGEAATPSKVLMDQERTAALGKSIEQLSPAYRRVIILRNVEQKAFAEIGRLMDRSPQAVCKLWVRALRALREELLSRDVSR